MLNILSSMKGLMQGAALLAVFLGTAFAFDGRYLHVSAFEKYTNTQRKESLEDKLFALEQKSSLNKTEKAFYERYKRQLEEVNKRLEKK